MGEPPRPRRLDTDADRGGAAPVVGRVRVEPGRVARPRPCSPASAAVGRTWAASLRRRSAWLAAWLAALSLFSGCDCEGPRRQLAEVPEVPYPECAGGEGQVVLERVLRSGPQMREADVVERFEVRRHGECRVVRVWQEWSRGTADLDVVFDAEGQPLRVWKRTTLPDAQGPIGHRDVRMYDLSGAAVVVARRGPTGEREAAELRGPRPTAVIGPGRGLLTAWIQRAALDVGGRSREPVLDVREPLALIRDVTLQRQPDQEVEGLGRVRVYTIYGREPVFTDEDDVVVGDMFGLRRADAVPGPVPDPSPDRGPIDPTAFE